MARITARKSGTTMLIDIAGEAAAHHCAKACEFLKTIVDGNCSGCRIDMTKTTEADLSYLQMLLAFRRSMNGKGKTVSFSDLPSGHAVTAAAASFGLSAEFAAQEQNNGL